MAGAQFKQSNDTPRATPSPFNVDPAPVSLVVPISSAPKNHPSFAESFTSKQPEASVRLEPQGHGGALKRSQADEIISFSSNEFPVPPAAVQPVEIIPAEKVAAGEYHPGIIDEMFEFFDRPKVKEIYDTYTWKSGAVTEKVRYVPNTPPHFSEFARKIGVTTRTLKRWAREHPEFRDAYEQCQEIFEEFLIDNGLTGSYGAIAMKFVAVNRSKMKDKVVQENQNVDINKVLDQIADGKVKPGGLLPEGDSGDDY